MCGFFYLICRYKPTKITLLSLLLSSQIPTFALLFKNIEPYFCPTFSQKVTGQPVSQLLFAGNYILNYLATRPKLVHYVLQALVQVGLEGLQLVSMEVHVVDTLTFDLIRIAQQ